MYRLMIGVMLLAWLGLFVIKGPSGQPLLSLEDIGLSLDSLDLDPDIPETQTGPPAPKRVYTWKDDQGVTQFSDHEEDAAGATVLELNGITNTIPALPLPASEAAKRAPVVTSETAVLPLPIQDAMTTMEQARQLQKTLDARKAEIDKLANPGN